MILTSLCILNVKYIQHGISKFNEIKYSKIACKYLGEWQEKGIFTPGNEHSGMSLHVCIYR